MDYIYTIRGSRSEEQAIGFMVDILTSEYGFEVGDQAIAKGFKRTLAQSDEEINARLKKMHALSPGEYAYAGLDQKDGLSMYTFWGKTGSHKKEVENGIS